jgi:hypothetical protein
MMTGIMGAFAFKKFATFKGWYTPLTKCEGAYKEVEIDFADSLEEGHMKEL